MTIQWEKKPTATTAWIFFFISSKRQDTTLQHWLEYEQWSYIMIAKLFYITSLVWNKNFSNLLFLVYWHVATTGASD